MGEALKYMLIKRIQEDFTKMLIVISIFIIPQPMEMNKERRNGRMPRVSTIWERVQITYKRSATM